MSMARSACYLILVTITLLLAVAQAAAKDTGPRLKYRSKGPVCYCGAGISEAEISRAMKREGLDRLQASSPNAGTEKPKDDGQHSRREADEKRK